uniref:ribosomal protein L6 n=1 Tax=Porphyridium aerugineum TaxID=2792 RepID=UPI001FCE2819|nr:ribosomal protein L6 [Porphyridium aerugineum]UNJ17877.1 ribosomal protein L6 [Porphyridium aerugineum]
MSRIGKKVIIVPTQVKVEIKEQNIYCKGPKGESNHVIPPSLSIKLENNEIQILRKDDKLESKSLYGMTRTLINNIIVGVSQGFSKKLEIQGVGYKSQNEGKNLILNVGYSHPVKIEPPEGITLKADTNVNITVSGSDKQMVGQVAAYIRSIRPPEPYKGKGIRYQGEIVRRKVGKTGKK